MFTEFWGCQAIDNTVEGDQETTVARLTMTGFSHRTPDPRPT